MHQNETKRSWDGQLDLQTQFIDKVTRLKKVKHCGPLKVQRPFYPADDGQCHVYLLHPPGGMACGDNLAFNIECTKNSHLLITTPAAGKIYGVKGLEGFQTQTINLNVGANAFLEWLPQETIVYDSAELIQHLDIQLEQSSSLVAMDIQCLGRRLSGESFRSGSLQLNLQLTVENKLLHVERLRAIPDKQSDLFQSLAGFQSRTVTGTLLMYSEKFTVDNNLCDHWQKQTSEKALISLTQKGPVVVCRYLGDNPEEARKLLTAYRNIATQLITGSDAIEPRIWNT